MTHPSDLLEQELAHLINLTGKMRMLSHQVVMFALLECQAGKTPDCADKLRTALAEFRGIANGLIHPRAGNGLSSLTAQFLTDHPPLTGEQRAMLERFVHSGEALADKTTPERAATLAQLVSGPLLAHLNAIIDTIRLTLETTVQDRRAAQDPLRRTATASVDEIHRLSKALQIVAMNASLEAQRAGDEGAAFGAIAREMRALSQKSLEQAHRLDVDFSGIGLN